MSEKNVVYFKKLQTDPDGKNVYNFHYEYNDILYQTTIRTNLSTERALEEAVKTLQFELMHANIALLNWKEGFFG